MLNCPKLDTVKNYCSSVYLIKGEEISSEGVTEVNALATLIESEMLPESVIEVAYKGLEALKNNVRGELTGENHQKR